MIHLGSEPNVTETFRLNPLWPNRLHSNRHTLPCSRLRSVGMQIPAAPVTLAWGKEKSQRRSCSRESAGMTNYFCIFGQRNRKIA